MPRSKKDAKILNIKLSTPVHNDLQRICNESGQTKTFAVERALVAYIEDYDKKQTLLKKYEHKK